MSVAQFALALARLLAVVMPTVAAARWLRIALIDVRGPVAALSEIVLTISLLLLEAEIVGVLGLLRTAPLIVISFAAAAVARLAAGRLRARRREAMSEPLGIAPPAPEPEPATSRGGRLVGSALATGGVIVVAQWALESANALGGGMFNFDTLWYHMPFAAGFAVSGSVTGIHFTQADSYTAYYPANSELVHAIGIVLMHGDVISPLVNLGWLAVMALACWCAGIPWRLRRYTMLAGLVIAGLPVLSTTQPGEAFNDIPGLAMLLAGAALLLNASARRSPAGVETVGAGKAGPGLPMIAGLALGFSVGTKYTFLVPAFALAVGYAATAASGARVKRLAMVLGPLGLTAGWWYLRNILDIANPLGVQLHLGPITIPGPISPLATSQEQTVISEVKHLSLWTSRFAPGLAAELGVLWPVLLAGLLVAVIGGLASSERRVRTVAAAAGVSAVAYLVFPTGATDIVRGPMLFEVNLRYLTPALALGLLVVPVVLQRRRPRWLALYPLALVTILLVAQFEKPLWPTQTARHGVFLAGAGLLALAWSRRRALQATLSRQRLRRLPVRPAAALLAAAIALPSTAAVAYAVQRHFYIRRYLVGNVPQPGIEAIYRWAQHVSSQRIALYGALAQYPLYGARDTNDVVYLGQPTVHGGYQTIASCQTWRQTVDRGHFTYLVLTPVVQTGPVPVGWTQADPAARVVLHPAQDTYVFRLYGPLNPATCP